MPLHAAYTILELYFGIEKDLIARVIEMCPRVHIPELVYEYFIAYRAVEDDGEYHGNDILSIILERHKSKTTF